MNFHALEIFLGGRWGVCGLKPKDKRVTTILATFSKGLIIQKLLQLECFSKICCSATLSLAIR